MKALQRKSGLLLASLSLISLMVLDVGCKKKAPGAGGEGSEAAALQGGAGGVGGAEGSHAGKQANSHAVANGAVGGIAVGAGGNTTVNVGTGTTSGSAGAPAAAPVEKGPDCFNITYTHKRMASHKSDESCSRHRNLIKLKHTDVNLKSLCVRVNGTPVRFKTVKKHSDEIVVGPQAGPDAKITARYCIGKVACKEDCTIPRDEFLDALGGEEDTGAVQLAQWDSEDGKEANAKAAAKINSDLKRELAEVDEAAGGLGTQENQVFKEWISEKEEAKACGNQHASK